MRRAFIGRASFLFLVIALGFGPVLAAHGQDTESPSLGDVARQARLAKQQKDGQETRSAAEQPGNTENPAGSPGNASNDASSQSAAAPALKSSPIGTQNKAEKSPSVAKRSSAAGKSGKKVLTNEDIGAAHTAADSAPASEPNNPEAESSNQADAKNPPDYWVTRILAQKNAIASLKSDIDQLSASIQYAPGNCVSGCVEWNEQQQQKQQQVDTMKAQLEEQQKQLGEMQEAARKQGYGSSVYDP